MTNEIVMEGDEAPDFELSDEAGRVVRLSSFTGRRVVIDFYPDQVAASASSFDFEDAVVLGVSPQPAEKLRGSDAAGSLPAILLRDSGEQVAGRYGAGIGPTRFRRSRQAGRTTFLIGPDRKVQRVLRNVDPRAHDAFAAEELATAVPSGEH